MEYWIDGYNVIGRARWLQKLTLEQAREKLVRGLVPLGSPVRVYFDASKPGASSRSDGGTPDPRIKVSFIRKGTADDAMLEALREAKANSVTIVTDDRDLRGRARQLGAITVAVDKFLEKIELAITPPASPIAPKDPVIGSNPVAPEKPRASSKKEIDEFLKLFSEPLDTDDPERPFRQV